MQYILGHKNNYLLGSVIILIPYNIEGSYFCVVHNFCSEHLLFRIMCVCDYFYFSQLLYHANFV